ncbi:uncharacterized protein LY89DRAFT_180647 [Mollisia scopiformis]|uniref:Uncharacterized protein n=1 Tax=Mollisia scopiformis TaxID=149040 RepID=A0A194XTB4_MOLSC|nr:uncharacterized protein LY89DRAFT_180647 [Mollisia scopiformis]KUJ23386.1 hypothetical protein LY89DRAFT_180647 [Mollisia scopiformis]
MENSHTDFLWWESAVPGSQIIQIQVCVQNTSKSDLEPKDSNPDPWTFRINTRPCGLLRACHTSRKVWMRTHHSSIPLQNDQKLFFDAECDIIYLINLTDIPFGKIDRFRICPLFSPPIVAPRSRERFSAVKKLAIPLLQYLDLFSNCDMFEFLHNFKSLDTLHFILPSQGQSQDSLFNNEGLRFESRAGAEAVLGTKIKEKAYQKWSDAHLAYLADYKKRFQVDWNLPKIEPMYGVART